MSTVGPATPTVGGLEKFCWLAMFCPRYPTPPVHAFVAIGHARFDSEARPMLLTLPKLPFDLLNALSLIVQEIDA